MYHRLVDQPTADPYDVSRSTFEDHLRALAAEGFVGTAVARRGRAIAAGKRAVVITFDDGNASDADIALEILLRHGFEATFFITTGRVGAGDRWLDWSKARSLHDAGMEVGAHGHTHQFLIGLSDGALRAELETSHGLIAACRGSPPESMSCPGGRFDDKTIRAASTLGFRNFCTSEPRSIADGGEDFVIPRFQVRRDYDPALVCAIARNDPAVVNPMLGRFRNRERLRRLLGHRLYQTLWELRFGRIED